MVKLKSGVKKLYCQERNGPETEMKLFAKLMIAALLIAMALPFTVLKDDYGKPLMSLKDLKLPEFSVPDLPDMPKAGNLTSGSGEKDFFYKWYDSEGNVQFTTEPPPDGVEYTVKGYDPDTNLIQAVQAPKEEVQAAGDNTPDSGAKSGGLENPYDPESIKKLMEDAKNVQNILNQRYKDQGSATNQ